MTRDTHRQQPGGLRALKADLRKQVLAARDALGAPEREALSRRITDRLLAHEAYRAARCVMSYSSIGSEFPTAAFTADILATGRRLALPRVDRASHSIRVYEVRDPGSELAAGVWGIREPRPDRCRELAAGEIDFVLVPGVAYTRGGERLGYGAGYYDRLIGGFERRPALVAAAFELQVLAALPMSETDQRIDEVITESARYTPGGTTPRADG